MKEKMISAYMDVAERFAQLSSAKRLQVGAIVVKDDRIISIGYNGTPAGWDNVCEVREYEPLFEGDPTAKPWEPEDYPYEEEYEYDEIYFPNFPKADVIEKTGRKKTGVKRYRLTSKPEVMHAERNALDKLARGPESGAGATLFVTHAPCIECAKSIYGAGIEVVYYRDKYRSEDGIDFLIKAGVNVIHRDIK